MDFPIGQFMLTGLNFAPTGTLACNGDIVSQATYSGLFEALGARYGGDGTTNFALPVLPTGADQITNTMIVNGFYPPRS